MTSNLSSERSISPTGRCSEWDRTGCSAAKAIYTGYARRWTGYTVVLGVRRAGGCRVLVDTWIVASGTTQAQRETESTQITVFVQGNLFGNVCRKSSYKPV